MTPQPGAQTHRFSLALVMATAAMPSCSHFLAFKVMMHAIADDQLVRLLLDHCQAPIHHNSHPLQLQCFYECVQTCLWQAHALAAVDVICGPRDACQRHVISVFTILMLGPYNLHRTPTGRCGRRRTRSAASTARWSASSRTRTAASPRCWCARQNPSACACHRRTNII